MNKISQGGVKTSNVRELTACSECSDAAKQTNVIYRRYEYLLPDHKDIVDVLKGGKNNKNILTNIPFIVSSISVQIEAQLLNCIEDAEYKDLQSNILTGQIFNLINTIIEAIVIGNKDLDNRTLLRHNIMALFTIYKCNIASTDCKNLIAFIDYFCDQFIE